MLESRIVELILKGLCNTPDSVEKRELRDWVSASPEKRYFIEPYIPPGYI